MRRFTIHGIDTFRPRLFSAYEMKTAQHPTAISLQCRDKCRTPLGVLGVPLPDALPFAKAFLASQAIC